MHHRLRLRRAAIKRALLGLAVIAALSTAPALASASGPTITDAGSAFWTVRVDGAGFTPHSWAYVEVDDNGHAMGQWVQTTPMECVRARPCFMGGTVSAALNPSFPCTPGRVVWAKDFVTGVKSSAVPVACH